MSRINHLHCMPFSVAYIASVDLIESDGICNTLYAEGVGAFRHSALVISIEDEGLLWHNGVQEQRELNPEQFSGYPTNVELYNEDSYHQYTELISKNNLHHFKDIHMKNKKVTVHAIVGSQKCFVFNTLKAMLPSMSESASTSTSYTYYSLRATSTTHIFQFSVSEKIIEEKSGHRSLTALRQYECVTTLLQCCVAKTIVSADSDVVKSEEKKHQELEKGKDNE
uniref:Uncharacterized protein n=1 Tax=Amphimedon queenslandica TaxID=400682 RepID=A0A1X7UWY3_AMPQE